MRVGKRVQHPLSTGNGMPVKLCRRDDFPEDWPPTIISYDMLARSDMLTLDSRLT